MDADIIRVDADHADLLGQLMDVFARAFDDPVTYAGRRPSRGYLERLLGSPSFVCLAAVEDGHVIGGLAAYELVKFEQERSEFYIYDLAVRAESRRRGVATRLIMALKPIAAARGAGVIFVQADHGDDPAITLYSRLGRREDVIHFDIAVN